ncbi:MAG: MFS transporter, partial [Microbacteriaceae bacterium]|nr:MFS transporter [Microbacteriaceae bacterium]
MTAPALDRRVLAVAILAAFVAFLDGSIVTVALPAITDELGGGLPVQQWVVDAYLITLGALILLAGSLSDLLGRVAVLRIGLIGFGLTSLACGLAPTAELLIVARALQGVAGALLVPSSLALIMSAHRGEGQARAIGLWTAWTSAAFIVGPLLGGVLTDLISWRWVFVINVLPIVVTLVLMRAMRNEPAAVRTPIDGLGAALGAVGLGGVVFALIEQANYGWSSAVVLVPLVVGALSLIGFLMRQATAQHPMMPLSLFRQRNFAAGNLATVMIYAALSVSGLVIVVYLQEVAGLSATVSGLVMLPLTIMLIAFSSRFGTLAGRLGPRWFMAGGPALAAIGFVLLRAIETPFDFVSQALLGVLLYGLGVAITVAPLTSAILGAIEP